MKKIIGGAIIIVLLAIFAILRPFDSSENSPSSDQSSDSGLGADARASQNREYAANRENQENERRPTPKDPDDYELQDLENIEEVGKLSKEERDAKPKDISWGQWAYAVVSHRTEKGKNGDIEFYGKIVDENGKSIEGVSLKVQISAYGTSLKKKIESGQSSEIKEFRIDTDKNGMFQIKGENGADIKFTNLSKQGYEVAGKKKYWGYSFIPGSRMRHQSDPNHPVEFIMRRQTK